MDRQLRQRLNEGSIREALEEILTTGKKQRAHVVTMNLESVMRKRAACLFIQGI
jgi:hypothetical protein